MRAISKVLTVSAIFFSLTAVFSTMVLQAQEQAPISLDAHIHAEKDMPGLSQLLKHNKLEAAFLLSSSYSKMVEIQSWNPEDIANRRYPRIGIPERRLNIEIDHTQVSDWTRKFPGQLFGLCGMNLWWKPDFFREVLEKCLSKPGMIGVKLHFAENRNSLAGENLLPRYILDPARPDEVFSQFENLAAELNKRKSILLIHFDFIESEEAKQSTNQLYANVRGNRSGTGGSPKDDSEAKKLVEVAIKNPNVKFIIAHSGVGQTIGLIGLRYIGRTLMDNPSRNIYLEVSSTLFQNGVKDKEMKGSTALIEAWKRNSDIVEAWNEFGMDWILFGSDGDEQAREQIELNPLLSREAKDKILFKNGRRLILDLNLQ